MPIKKVGGRKSSLILHNSLFSQYLFFNWFTKLLVPGVQQSYTYMYIHFFRLFPHKGLQSLE